MSEHTVQVVTTGHVKHNGVHYAPATTIRLSEADAERLVQLGVARIQEAPSPPPPPPPPPVETDPESIAGMKAREAVEALGKIDDPELIRQVVAIEQAKESPRSTLIDAAERRLAELGGGE